MNLDMTPDQLKQLTENTKMTRDIHRAVVGDEELGHKGLVKQVAESREKIEEHDTKFTKLDLKIARWGGIIFGLLVAWEAYKALVIGISAH